MDRIKRKEKFIHELAEFLGGTNQARMSIALGVGGQFGEVAKIWAAMRDMVPGMIGYPTVEESEKLLRDFLM